MTVVGTWTYPGDPNGSDLYKVRFLVGDTDSTDKQLSDEEILWMLSEYSTVRKAAAECARALAGKYARNADKAVGDLRISASQRSKHYNDLAVSLALQALLVATPSYGGVSVSDKQANEQDTDLVSPSFRRGVHDNPDVLQDGGPYNSTTST